MTRSIPRLLSAVVAAGAVTYVLAASTARVNYTDAVVLDAAVVQDGIELTVEAQGAQETFLCRADRLHFTICLAVGPGDILTLVGQPSAVDADVPAVELLELHVRFDPPPPPPSEPPPDADGRG